LKCNCSYCHVDASSTETIWLVFYVRDISLVTFSHERLLTISIIIWKILASNVPFFSIMSFFIAVAFLVRDIARRLGHLEIFLLHPLTSNVNAVMMTGWRSSLFRWSLLHSWLNIIEIGKNAGGWTERWSCRPVHRSTTTTMKVLSGEENGSWHLLNNSAMMHTC
jgi:hypothetical protein